MTNIVGLHGNPIPIEPVPKVVEIARELLRRAESGEIRGIAYAVSKDSGYQCDQAYEAEPGAMFALVAGLNCLMHAAARQMGCEHT